MLLRTARRKGAPSTYGDLSSRNKPRKALVFAPSAFACSIGAPVLREISRDMEQNSEDSWGTKRSAEIHSDEVQRARVSLAQAKCRSKVVRPALCDEASEAMQEQPEQPCSCSATHFVAKAISSQASDTAFAAVLRNIGY